MKNTMNDIKLLESSTLKMTIPMHVFARHGDWALCQYNQESWAESFIYNTRKQEVYAGYPSLDDDDLIDDWYNLTGEGGIEE